MKRETFNKALGIDAEINHNELMLRKVEKLRGYYADDTPQPKVTIKIVGEEIEVSVAVAERALEAMSNELGAETKALKQEFEEL